MSGQKWFSWLKGGKSDKLIALMRLELRPPVATEREEMSMSNILLESWKLQSYKQDAGKNSRNISAEK